VRERQVSAAPALDELAEDLLVASRTARTKPSSQLTASRVRGTRAHRDYFVARSQDLRSAS